jgi:hypothetical protein
MLCVVMTIHYIYVHDGETMWMANPETHWQTQKLIPLTEIK